MSNITNLIEKYIKSLLAQSQVNYIDIQRNELAISFSCVPSQINYVLATRFTTEHGYMVESKRGGGGYVRITRIPLGHRAQIINYLGNLIGEHISQQSAEGIISRLLEEEVVTVREAKLLKAAISKDVLKLALPVRDRIRAGIFKAMLYSLFK